MQIKSPINKHGFTMIELILSLTLISIIFGFTMLYYRNSQIRADINSQAQNIAHHLRLAQSSASSGLQNTNHGVHFETSSYTIFKGPSFNLSDSSNFTINLPETITINNINLNGGENDIIFSKINGETENYGTISINSTQINKTVTITVTSVGSINY